MSLERYSRQVILPEVGSVGQKKLEEARVLIVGMGGLGTPAALYLSAAGIGTLGLIDGDHISLSNLPRQILYNQDSIGSSKVKIAHRKLHEQNPETQIEIHNYFLNADNALDILSKYDLILDGTDQFDSKYLINDAAAILKKPLIYGSAQGMSGEVALVNPHAVTSHGGCLRCYRPLPPQSPIQNCNESGILGPIAGMIGTMQATLALQEILSKNGADYPITPNQGILYQFDFSQSFECRSFLIRKNPKCLSCGLGASQNLNFDQEAGISKPKITFAEIDQKLSEGQKILILDVREKEEWDQDHHPAADHWPLNELKNGNLPTRIKEYDLVICYCRSGTRSEQATKILIHAGIRNVLSATPFHHSHNILSSKLANDA